jgi:hypothetical protein
MRRLLRHPAMPGALIGLAALLVASGIPADAASTVSRALFASRAKVARTARNANRVDGLSASRTPIAGHLLALNADGELPAGVLPGGGAGPQSPRGPEGPKGPQGPQGPAGSTGSPAFGIVLGRGFNVGMSPKFFAPAGESTSDPDENHVSAFTPDAEMTASDLSISLTQAPGLTESRTFTLRIGNQDTALSCTVPGGNSVCTSDTKVTIPPHTLISIGQTATGAPPLTDVRFGWRATS